MKICSGFVSNSSSSSFVILGERVRFDTVDLKDGNKYYALGDAIDSGDDVFEITKELLPILKYFRGQFRFVKGIMFFVGDQVSIQRGTYHVWSGDADYSAGENLEDRYSLADNVTLEMIEIDNDLTEESKEKMRQYL